LAELCAGCGRVTMAARRRAKRAVEWFSWLVKRRPTRLEDNQKAKQTQKKLRGRCQKRSEKERRAGHIAQRRKAQRPANKVKRHTAIGRWSTCH